MESSSRERQEWDEQSFRSWIKLQLKNSPAGGKLTFPNSIYNLGWAIHSRDTREAQRIFNELSHKNIVIKWILLYGAEKSCSLVKFLVEQGHISRFKLLSAKYVSDSGRNAIHITIENDRDDVVAYLLEEWAQTLVGTL